MLVAASSSMGEATDTWFDCTNARSFGMLELCVNSTEESTTRTYFVVTVASSLHVTPRLSCYDRIFVDAARSFG